MVAGDSPVYKVSRGEKTMDTHSFDSVLYRNSFSTNYPITLLGMGFFGPSSTSTPDEIVTYEVEYEVSYSVKPDFYYLWFFKRKNIKNPVLAKGKVTVHATREKQFYINLGGVNIPANTSIDIAFCLEGPPTNRLAAKPINVIVPTKYRRVRFDFNQGSTQMADLYFCMEEDKD